MAVQRVCVYVFVVSFFFFGVTSYNDNNNIKPLVCGNDAASFVFDWERRDSPKSEPCVLGLLARCVSDGSVSSHRLRSSMIEVVPANLDSSNRTALLIRAGYNARMHPK